MPFLPKDNMMKLTFKDVGQGDSVLLEWVENGVSKIGIIDCNRKLGLNPVLDHLKAADYKIIEFIVLSHPHEDHYSGMLDLLNYFEENNIPVRMFGHTLHLLGNDYHKYLNGVETGTKAKRDLEGLFNKVDILRRKNIIKFIDFLVEGSVIEIMEGISMKCLSPCITEARYYMEQVDLQPMHNKTKASLSANHLSTIFKLVYGDKYFLLTADSEIPTFERIIEQDRHKRLTTKELFIAQVPHHGASKNNHPAFWEYVKKHNEPQAVVSAGLHEMYKHPHLPVLMGFHEKGFTIHSTNIVYGMVEYVHYLKEISDLTFKLDTFTELKHSNTGGDKVFNIDF